VASALAAYAAGEATEHSVLTAVAASRLLVPVVAVLAEADSRGAEKETEMALPTLIGDDGRKAVIAFTSTETIKRWRADARPVPVPAVRLWPAAESERAQAVVIDVAGPVPLVVEGARLRALAQGEPPPRAHEDADIRAAAASVFPGCTLGPGDADAELVITLGPADQAAGDPAARAAQQADRQAAVQAAARQLAARLAPRLRRGIAVRLG
jgi:hypothetical protein